VEQAATTLEVEVGQVTMQNNL